MGKWGKNTVRVHMMGCQFYTKAGGKEALEATLIQQLTPISRPVIVAIGERLPRKSMRSLLHSNGSPVGIGMTYNRLAHPYLVVKADLTKEHKLRKKWRITSEIDMRNRFREGVDLLVSHYTLPDSAKATLLASEQAFVELYDHYL